MVFLVQDFSELSDFVFILVSYPGIGVDTAFFKYLLGQRGPDAIDIGQGYFHTFIPGQINAGYTCQTRYTSWFIPVFVCVWGFRNNYYRPLRRIILHFHK